MSNPFLPSGISISANRNNTIHRQRYIKRQPSIEHYEPSEEVQGDFSEFEAVLREIHEGWSFMLDDDFDPVTLTMKLMDDSSVGRKKDYKAFQRILHKLDMALKTIVNDYYKGFNNSIGTFGGVLQYINDSSFRAQQMKNNLTKCKEQLLEKRTDLLNLWYKSQQYKEMLNILETIDELRTTPDKADAFMESKQLLGAAKLIVNSIKMVTSKEMLQIGALDDIRRRLAVQKNVLFDMLVEELHTLLYLKNIHSENRWRPYNPRQQDLPEIPIKPRVFKESSYNDHFEGGYTNVDDMFAAENDILAEDPEKDPDTDAYYFMEIIMEAFQVLDEIPSVLETIQERLPIEIHSLVDKTIAEVEKRHLNQWLNTTKLSERNKDESDMYCLDKANSEAKNEILKDLLWTLFSKLESVLRGHRFVEACARRIKKRLLAAQLLNPEDGPTVNFSVYHFHEIWRPVQTEVRSLLQDYLTNQDQAIVSVDSNTTKKTYRGKRDKPKQLFSFAEVSQNPELDESYDALKKKLFNSFKRQATNADSAGNRSYHGITIDKYANDMSSKGHKILVKPDAYNVSVLLKPTLCFLQRVKEVFPSYDDSSEEGFGSFLDDFAINVFLPQIEEKVMQLIQHATVGLDSFQDARDYRDYSRYPIAKSAVALISVVQSLCRTMHNMPFHIDEYLRLIEIVLLKFYEKAYQRFYSTVARGSSYSDEPREPRNTTDVTVSTSGDWAQDESLVGLLAQNPFFNDEAEPDDEFTKALNQAEITMELKLKNDRLLTADELIFDSKKLTSLGRLYHTLKWFVREIWDLRSSKLSMAMVSSKSAHHKDHDSTDDSEDDTPEVKNSKRWSSQEPRPVSIATEEDIVPVLLPLRGEIAKRFDALLTTYQQLAETCLFTLRLEGRCHTMYYLEMAMREGNYRLEDETFEPDPYVITLNSDLMELDDCIISSLPPKDEAFAFDGLPGLIVYILMTEATYIKRLNNNGVQKMIRNILALQQNLSNFVPLSQCSIMERAREYYQLYTLGSEGMIRSIQENGPQFTFDEYRVILGLIHDINKEQVDESRSPTATSPNPDSNRQSNSSNYSEWLLKLDDIMADYET
ncbi:Sec8 exocyst complex component-specific domain-containing protein [Pilobolus umbonatus]|nr:Sec8 exocyst complex component-specific domain-containing protein [Pilobolus umbonatus]